MDLKASPLPPWHIVLNVQVPCMFTSFSRVTRGPQGRLRGPRSCGWWTFSLRLVFFCRVMCTETSSSFLIGFLNFDTMKFGATRARRLSTASSVTKPPHFILTTNWVWYWTDEFGSWQEYGRQVSVMERGWVFLSVGPWWRSLSKHGHKDCSREPLTEPKIPTSPYDSLALGELWQNWII